MSLLMCFLIQAAAAALLYLLLQGSGSNCMNAAVSGNYQQGVALTSSNKVTIEVNVTTPGTLDYGYE